MDDTSFGFDIPTLTSRNFPIWKIKLRDYLLAKDLAECITVQTPPTDALELAKYKSKRSHTAGVFTFCVDSSLINRFRAAFETDDPVIIWQALLNHFESKSPENQAKVFQDFICITCKPARLDSFIADITCHLSLKSAVGLIIGNSTNVDIREWMVAEFLISKLPSTTEFLRTKETLFAKRPLSIETVIEEIKKCHMY